MTHIDTEFDGWRKSSFSNGDDNCVEVAQGARPSPYRHSR
ncbi:MAG: DUF397 domain-containing protein [Pseudonocardiaceae bacterium]